jgi:3D (Asp-Asp-Asp) domain-containing protein
MIALVGGLLLPSDYVETEILTKWGIYEVTAYTLRASETGGKTPSHPAYGITASGKRVEAGVTIACPRELPFGTRVEIEGVGERVCWDTGGAIKGRKLDLYIPSLKEALKFGRQELRVRIIKEETE